MKNNLDHIIKQCLKNDATAQKELYDTYKGVLFGICFRYMKNKEDAEDVFIEAFYKILSKIHKFKGDGSFEGWMKRIVVNESLMALRKKNNLSMAVEIMDFHNVEEKTALDDLLLEDLMSAINELPVGYRTVFNLYEVDGFKHREIAEQLGISINTSKSQLILAKRRLREFVKKKQLVSINKSV
jgi:RNA polymerase sigma-70 factor (ECF subfamily)